MDLLTMDQLDLKGRRLLIRSDLNVPFHNGHISSDARIFASLPSYRNALDKGAKVMVMSHLGRPVEGEYNDTYSLAPVAERLSQLLGRPVRLEKNWLDNNFTVSNGELVLLENVRFNQGEKKNDEALSKKMASLCDVYIMDAFGTAHRKQASTYGVGKYAPVAGAGPLLSNEIEALNKVLANPRRPLLSIIGGAKVSTKLSLLEALSKKCDQLIPGGGIANTFLAAAGYTIGKSLAEKDFISRARQIMEQTRIPLPVDVVVSQEISASATPQVKSVENIHDDEMILDIGPETRKQYSILIAEAGTLLWNGPVGVFEFDAFGEGTKSLAKSIAESSAYSVAGGGDTLAAIEKYGIRDKISYISTGGGAFLEYVEGTELPAIEMLRSRASR